jgi:hypothetical protein
LEAPGYKDSWHRYIDLYFCIACDHCQAELPLAALSSEEQELDFDNQCFRLSELAQQQGWIELADGWSFICPACAIGEDKNST